MNIYPLSNQPMLTPKQKRILEYIRDYIAHHGVSPSLRDIMNAFSLSSPSSVHRYLSELEKKNYITRGGYHSKRSLSLVGKALDEIGAVLPFRGAIAAGAPLDVAEETTETVEVPSMFSETRSDKPRYVLQVSGDSMIDMGLLDGDYVVIEHREYAQEGEVIAALLNGGATLKEYRRRGGAVMLYPKNSNYEPITVTQHDEFLIRGVLVGSFRQYA